MVIAVLNNYSFRRVEQEVTAGAKPAHHLYGTDQLAEHGFHVEFVEPVPPRWLAGLVRVLGKILRPIPLGDLAQQWECWRNRERISLVYCPCQTQHHLLAVARALGLFRVPIVVLAHHPLNQGRLRVVRDLWWRLVLQGVDAFPSLSRRVADEINALAGRTLSTPLAWGPDPDYQTAAPSYPGNGFFCVGRTGRDFATFGRAATLADVEAEILCLESSRDPAFAEFGPRVTVRVNRRESASDYQEMGRRFAEARALAIPLGTTETLAGLTSLTDALAAGKPVIMTRHPLIDLDLEKAGIGITVPAADVNAWVEALKYLETHPEEAIAMGRRARALVDDGQWSSRTFNAALHSLIKSLLPSLPALTNPVARTVPASK